MPSSSAGPSPGIIAAGVSAILAGIFGALSAVLALVAMLGIQRLPSNAAVPVYAKTLSEIIWGFFFLAACFLIWSGIGILRLRKWARISLLVFAGMMLFFGLIGLLVILFVFLLSSLPGPAGAKAILLAGLVLIYGIPIALALWWMIALTRPAVVAQFEAKAGFLPPRPALRFSKPGCPLPVSIVAWFLLSTVLSVVIVPFLPFQLPVVFFGRLFVGPPAMALFLGQFLLIAAAGAGLLRLWRWSFPVTVGLQLLYIANGLVTFLSPNYAEHVRAIVNQMQIPAAPAGVPDFLPYTRYFAWIGLLVPTACVVALLYSREAFYAAAAAPPPASAPSTQT